MPILSYQTRLRNLDMAVTNQWLPGDEIITNSPYKAAKAALEERIRITLQRIEGSIADDRDLWLDRHIEVQVIDAARDDTETADWDTYTLIARQTLTISDA